MERVFLKTVGRFKRGMVKDWPITTWATFFPDWRSMTADVEPKLPPMKQEKAHANS